MERDAIFVAWHNARTLNHIEQPEECKCLLGSVWDEAEDIAQASACAAILQAAQEGAVRARMEAENKTTVRPQDDERQAPPSIGLTAEDMRDLDSLSVEQAMFRPYILRQPQRIRAAEALGETIEVYVQVSPTLTKRMPYGKAVKYCQATPPQPRKAWRDGRGVRWISAGALSEDDLRLAQPMLAQGQQRIAEHRLVMARLLGRPLRPGEYIRHIDGDKRNNDPRNLRLQMRCTVVSGLYGRSFYDEWQRSLAVNTALGAKLQAAQEALSAQEAQFGDALDELVALLEGAGRDEVSDPAGACAVLLDALWAWVGAPPCGDVYIHSRIEEGEEEGQRHESLDRGNGECAQCG